MKHPLPNGLWLGPQFRQRRFRLTPDHGIAAVLALYIAFGVCGTLRLAGVAIAWYLR